MSWLLFAKFHEDRTKIVDFSLMANFWKCAVFFSSDFKQLFFTFSDLYTLSASATHEAVHFLCQMLTLDPEKRVNVVEALNHPYLDEGRLRYHSCMCTCCTNNSGSNTSSSQQNQTGNNQQGSTGSNSGSAQQQQNVRYFEKILFLGINMFFQIFPNAITGKILNCHTFAL